MSYPDHLQAMSLIPLQDALKQSEEQAIIYLQGRGMTEQEAKDWVDAIQQSDSALTRISLRKRLGELSDGSNTSTT